MRIRLLVALFGLLAVTATEAREVRYPETGDPAFTFTIPDGWNAQLDNTGNLLMTPAENPKCGLAISYGSFDGSLDRAANTVMTMLNGAPPTRAEPASISGYAGYVYTSEVSDGSGNTVSMRLSLVRIEPKTFASVTLLTWPGAPGAQTNACESVQRSATISRVD